MNKFRNSIISLIKVIERENEESSGKLIFWDKITENLLELIKYSTQIKYLRMWVCLKRNKLSPKNPNTKAHYSQSSVELMTERKF